MAWRWGYRLLQECGGNVIIVAAASLPVLIGAAGLATDTAQWGLTKRQVQRQADSAALAGALAVAQGFDAVASAREDLARNALVTLTGSPVVENAPTAGPNAGNMKAVRVVLQTSKELPFSAILGIKAPIMTGEATASMIETGSYCVISLENTNTPGIMLKGSANIELGCGMKTNSRSANAVDTGGSSMVVANPVAAVGGLQPSSNYAAATTFAPYSIPEPDPYARLPTPYPSGCRAKIHVAPLATSSISPGCYKGIDVKGSLEMEPGIYYVDGSDFEAGSQATITGTGVTIILTSGSAVSNPSQIATVNINAGATLNLTATSYGTYSGVLFYQDRRALDARSNMINGNSESVIRGGLYFPNQELHFSGTSGMKTECVQIVSRRVVFTGNSKIVNECPANAGAKSFTGHRVRLVG